VPDKWADVAYRDLRAEGAFAVSARREGGKTAWVKVRSERGGQLRLRDPFAGAAASWNRDDVKKVGDDYVSTLAAGEVLEGRPAP
jgi:alpha-L-fucosidase 2